MEMMIPTQALNASNKNTISSNMGGEFQQQHFPPSKKTRVGRAYTGRTPLEVDAKCRRASYRSLLFNFGND
ncbi:hypothetical protein CHS0354_042602 [Potamilus streckersoni]|uniref:Uncharacterized protein n=1 Tax=Potamilus streckersoni TaxID=2493646 RepID=A0AAE0TEV7_9BIVA|nr:hypothetical protein CHS0354_042602 [Potamilus streckersoni]